jgi:acetoin utilization protein AcuB
MDRVELKRLQILQALEAAWFADKREPLCVRHVMTVSPTVVSEETSVIELVRLLHRHGFRHLLVTDSAGCLVGVLSDRDVIRCFGPDRDPDKRRLAWLTAADIMSRDLITIAPTARLEVAIDMLVMHGISCLPVVVDDTIRGIVTNTDLNLLLQLLLKTTVGAPSNSQRLACCSPGDD